MANIFHLWIFFQAPHSQSTKHTLIKDISICMKFHVHNVFAQRYTPAWNVCCEL